MECLHVLIYSFAYLFSLFYGLDDNFGVFFFFSVT